MNIRRRSRVHAALMISVMLALSIAASRMNADTGTCGGQMITLPFTDVPSSNVFFCSIAEAFFSSLTNGTTTTTYGPASNVPREQMAAFVSRTLDQSLKRGSMKAVTEKWWTPQGVSITTTVIGSGPRQVKFDGTDVWVANETSGTVTRVRPSDGKVLDTWTGATNAFGILSALGRIFITGATNPGSLYILNPGDPPGTVGTLSSTLGTNAAGIAFDGLRIWTANTIGSVSIVAFGPDSVTTVSTGFTQPLGILYDGANMWVTDTVGNLLKLNPDGSIAQTITVGAAPAFPVFDGTNIWVPNFSSNSVSVVRVKDAGGNPLATCFVLATLTGNGLNAPVTATFDGERILVADNGGGVSLWKAADLSPLGAFPTEAGIGPYGACSDGLNFFITNRSFTPGRLERF